AMASMIIEIPAFVIITAITFVIVYKIAIMLFSFLDRLTGYPTALFFSLYLAVFIIASVLLLTTPKLVSSLEIDKEDLLSADPKETNVIVCVLDCLRYDFISVYGADIATPAIEGIAKEGITYRDVYANSNWTKPATASLLTSAWPDVHNVQWYNASMPEELITLAEVLEDNHYTTAGFSTNPHVQTDTGFDQGFDDFYYLKGKMTAVPYDREAPQLRLLKLLLPDLIRIFPRLRAFKSMFSNAKVTTDMVIRWLKMSGKTPFFLYLHYMDAHSPYHDHPYKGERVIPYIHGHSDDDVDRFVNLYKEEIEFFDKHFARLIEFLKSEGIYDKTMIVFTADHGEEFFEHYLWEHGASMYDEVLHIPLIIKAPQIEKEGVIDTSLVAQIDIAPTILDLLDLRIPQAWLGESLVERDSSRNFVVSQAINGNIGDKVDAYSIHSIATRNFKLMEVDSGYSAVKMSKYRGVPIDPRGIFPEKNLFDRINDPAEMVNLYGDPEYDSVLIRLRQIDSLAEETINDNAIATQQRELDSELIEKLKAIGYIN
ncbi:MAG: sulfatase-like hydrolase/transferase, partial [candidate division Zixibacteria bacterium]|nr:sulfatase-like hydrolase/transferase [candidate division Zixibacteria bacterium]